MSLSTAIYNAMSGMRATSAAADITGSNLANATNENYARRELMVEASTVGPGGVKIVGVRRHHNPVMAAAWRTSNSASSMAHQQTRHAETIQVLYGDPTQSGSLTNRLNRFEEALVAASARPELSERLTAAVGTLDDLVDTVNTIGTGIQRQREDADRQIANMASRMNDILGQLEQLNVRMVQAASQGKEVAALQDHQDQLVDELSAMTDIRVYSRERNTVAIYGTGGAVLLDNQAARIDFERTAVITPDMSLSNGMLGGMIINGEPASAGSTQGKLRGGELGALFEYRDVTAREEQTQIDAFAYDLAQRLNNPPPTVPPPALGDTLFLTDEGGVPDPGDVTGLANRLTLNPAVVPGLGGDPRRMRDGLLAGGSGEVGDATRLNGLLSSMSANTTVQHGAFAGETLDIDSFAVRLSGRTNYEVIRLQDAEAFASTQSEMLRAYRLEDAVDSDAELQKLMLLEQAYAANAQVLRTVDEMMDILMGVV